jgi:hypothetical protein
MFAWPHMHASYMYMGTSAEMPGLIMHIHVTHAMCIILICP